MGELCELCPLSVGDEERVAFLFVGVPAPKATFCFSFSFSFSFCLSFRAVKSDWILSGDNSSLLTRGILVVVRGEEDGLLLAVR